MNTNKQIIKNTLTTADVASGLLNPEQSRQFLRQVFEATTLGGLIRREIRRAKTGEIDKIGIASRILRKKTENVDATSSGGVPVIDPATGQITGYRAEPNFSQVDYATTAVRLPWEITEETLRENIEGQGLEATVTNLMTTQLGIDLEDLYLNGDTAVDSGDTDHDFLYINDGWIKQIAAGGHVVDATGISGTMSLDMFYSGLQAMPNKYNNGRLRWLMSPHRAQEWELFLLNKGLNSGASFPDSLYNSPASIPTVQCPHMPDDKIILTDPQNLIVVNTYDVRIRKTVEGKEAIMCDKRFYVAHLDYDPIVEELDATAIITNIGAVTPPPPEG
jgi:hypothetical protein